MLQADSTNIKLPLREIKGKVELVNSSTTFSHKDNLKKFTIDRIGEEGKFFGFGVSQKLVFELVDKERVLNIETNSKVKAYLAAADDEYINNFPLFSVSEVVRDENTNALTITAYDALKEADKITVAQLELDAYTAFEFAEAAAAAIGAEGVLVDEELTSFDMYYETGANFEGSETVKEALTALAEATQTIYYLDRYNCLVFKRLKKDEAADLVITKADYFTLNSKTNKTLAAIGSVTELGDNYITDKVIEGATQYIRNNPFIELREDIADILDAAIAEVGGLTINQFNLNWRGNYLLEIGDKLEIITKDNSSVFSYVINDTITYSGALKEDTSWAYEDKEGIAANSTSLGEVLKQTFAKVDKQGKTIELVVSEAEANRNELSSLKLTTDSIDATVSGLQEKVDAATNEMSTLSTKVDAQITDTDLTIKVQQEIAKGVDKVVTGKGFTLDDNGITVEDLNPATNNVINTTISNNGMKVNSNGEEVLKANDEGVKAQDLHATTFLIIGNNSRFENYGSNRTGCFWIGG